MRLANKHSLAYTHRHTRSGLQSGWLGKVLTLQVEERLTVGLDPSVHSDVSVLLLKCLFLSYSFNYEEQEVKDSRSSPSYTHTQPYLSQNTTQTCTNTKVKCVIFEKRPHTPFYCRHICSTNGARLGCDRLYN